MNLENKYRGATARPMGTRHFHLRGEHPARERQHEAQPQAGSLPGLLLHPGVSWRAKAAQPFLSANARGVRTGLRTAAPGPPPRVSPAEVQAGRTRITWQVLFQCRSLDSYQTRLLRILSCSGICMSTMPM